MSIKEDLRRRILQGLIKEARGEDEFVVLVLDESATRIVSSACRMFDIMDGGVIVVENLDKKRERLTMPAIYFVAPTLESINTIIADFKDKPQYPKVHLAFTSKVPEHLFNKIAASPVVKYIKTLKELNTDFVAFESRVFHCARKNTLRNLYFSPNDVAQDELKATAKHIASVCLVMDEYPYIRYDASSKWCSQLAGLVEMELHELITKLPNWNFNKDRERGTILLVDRQMDRVGPLMHEFTYQALLNDYMDLDGEIAPDPSDVDDGLTEQKEDTSPKGKPKEKIVHVLSEDDPEWVTQRHEHVAAVSASLKKSLKDFKTNNKVANLGDSVEALQDALKDAPHFQALVRRYTKHIDLVGHLLKAFTAYKMSDLGQLEQDLACGVDDNGEKIDSKTSLASLKQLMRDKVIRTVDKLRLIILYTITHGSLGASLGAFFADAQISEEMRIAIQNLAHLGLDPMSKKGLEISKARRAEFSDQAEHSTYALMRFVPALKSVVKRLVADTLDHSAFPYTKEPPPKAIKSTVGGASKKRGNWRHKAEPEESKGPSAGNGPRTLVFLLGGLTFAESRCVYSVAEETRANLYVGSGEMLTPRKYLAQIIGLGPQEDLETTVRHGRKPEDDDYIL